MLYHKTTTFVFKAKLISNIDGRKYDFKVR